VQTPGDYQVIVQKDGRWTGMGIDHAIRGTIEVNDKKYDAVELLLDHRTR
jgi:hypothetical protein